MLKRFWFIETAIFYRTCHYLNVLRFRPFISGLPFLHWDPALILISAHLENMWTTFSGNWVAKGCWNCPPVTKCADKNRLLWNGRPRYLRFASSWNLLGQISINVVLGVLRDLLLGRRWGVYWGHQFTAKWIVDAPKCKICWFE